MVLWLVLLSAHSIHMRLIGQGLLLEQLSLVMLVKLLVMSLLATMLSTPTTTIIVLQ